jgi:RNA-directed DNA polymerase
VKPSKETRRVEGRGQPEGSLREEARVRTQSRIALPPNLERVNAAAKQAAQTRFTALLHHVDEAALLRAFRRQKRQASAGVDGVTVAKYEQGLTGNIRGLCDRVHTGRYRPQPVRRVYIPKADGGKRPLGVPALEDKIVQSAVAEVLSAVYEADFLGFSYGFRPGRNPHMALDALHTAIMSQRVNWVLDADIRSFFDSVDHEWLLRMLAHTGSPILVSCGSSGCGCGLAFLRAARSKRRTGVRRKGQVSARSLPTSSCTTSSTSGSINGVVAMHAVAS